MRNGYASTPQTALPSFTAQFAIRDFDFSTAPREQSSNGKDSYQQQTPTPRQDLFLKCTHREAFYGGSAGGGKSSALLIAALEYVHIPGYSALLLRRTFQDLSKPGALMDRAREWLAGSGATWNEQKKQWRFPSGAVIAFGYLVNESDIYQYQGAEYQFIGFDELTQFTERQYTYLFSRLRRLSGQNVPLRMRSASNPGGIGAEWVQQRFIPDNWLPEFGRDLAVIEKDGRAFVPAKLVDNPHLDQESYKQSLQELDEVTRAQLLEGDWQVRMRGNIYTSWSDGPNGHHVITWSQFKSVYGQDSIPEHWLGACGQDWGFDPDPCATIWNFVAAANGPLPGCVFVPKVLTCKAEIPDSIGDKIKIIESAEGWGARLQYRVMSHEASSQQATYRVKHDLSFQKWKPDVHGGIAQMQHMLRLIDTDKPHPFKPWLKGRPRYFLIVPDDQITNPKGDNGMAMLRAEFAQYRYTEQRITDVKGAAKIVPFDFMNHYMDAQRGIAAKWFAQVAALKDYERIERQLPEALQVENDPKTSGWDQEGWEMARQIALGKVKKAEEKRNQSLDDPWNGASPLDKIADSPWGDWQK
jgi:hypothetical protein